MQATVSDRGEPFGRTYAEPLSGLRVSWGSVLAGTVGMLAVSLILWALGLAIVSLATHPTAGSLKGSVIALWIISIATTLAGAVVGGFLAGYLPGNGDRTIGAAHAFIAWSLAFLVSFAFQLFIMRGLVNTAANALADTLAVVPGAAAGAAPGAGAPSAGQLTYAGHVALDYLVGASWTWFGTWFIAAVLAVAAGAAGAVRLRGGGIARKREPVERERPVTPLTPAPTP